MKKTWYAMEIAADASPHKRWAVSSLCTQGTFALYRIYHREVQHRNQNHKTLVKGN